MTEAEKLQALRREIHAGLAMHALVQQHATLFTAEMVAEQAYAIADAMIAKGGPLED